MSMRAITSFVRSITMDYAEQVNDKVGRTAAEIRGAVLIAEEAVRETADLYIVGAEEGARIHMARKFYTEKLKAIGIPEEEFGLELRLCQHNGFVKIAQLMDYGSELIVEAAEKGI